MDPFILKSEEYFSILSWENKWPELVVGFTTKNGGYSSQDFSTLNCGLHVGDSIESVRHNKQKLSSLFQFPMEHWVSAEQTHGINIMKVNNDACGKGTYQYEDSVLDTDGFYTSEKGILLTLCFADCVPLYFIDKKSKTIGIAHAGWKGSVNGIAKEMIVKWKNEDIEPKDIFVVIGPSICKNCYIVDDFVIQFVQKILEDVEKKPYNLIEEGQYQLDLKLLNKLILEKAGIPASNISITNYCSSCHENEFFSHRRDNGKTGRMMSFIGWKGEMQST
jgi:polyphenol oxidase